MTGETAAGMHGNPILDRRAGRRRRIGRRAPREIHPFGGEHAHHDVEETALFGGAAEYLMQCFGPFARWLAVRAKGAEGVAKVILLLGDEAIEAMGQTRALRERRRLRNGQAEHDRRTIDEFAFNAQIALVDRVGHRIGRDLAKQAVTDGTVPGVFCREFSATR